MESLFINRKIRISAGMITSLKRSIPDSCGKINIQAGEEVSPEDVLGEGQIFTGFIVIHLARELSADAKSAHLYLERRIGQTIYAGELLATRQDLLGLRKKLIFSPVDGIVDSYDEKTGDLKLRIIPRKTKLVSGVYGIVDKIDKKSGGIFIKTKVDMVSGVVGSGYEREGILKIIGTPEGLISSRQILPEHKGQILVTGGLIFLDALKKALNIQVAGIVTGGINAVDFKTLAGQDWNLLNKIGTDVGLTLVVIEGFGSAPIGADVYTLLKAHHGKFAIINGNTARLILPSGEMGSMIDIRKNKSPVEINAFDKILEVELVLGMRVRVISTTFLGTQGNVVALDQSLTQLPSGVMTFMVTLITSTGKIRVPYQNLEAI